MQDLLKIIQWKDELNELDYAITKLKEAEEDFVDSEEYEKANVMLKEQLRLRSRKKYLTTKINKL
jgi:protein-arginine kinase activator protein McsA